MLKYLFFLLSILVSLNGFSQATLFTEDFESMSPPWSPSDDLLPNSWTIKDCAGNGPSAPGTISMYITKGGIVNGCGPTGDIQYAYENAPTGTLMATEFATIDATCASNIQATFDYQIDGVSTEDFVELVYSTNGGATWTAVGSELPASAVWTTTTIGLPAAVDGLSFELGFRFTYNDATIVGNPPAIDNITITGTDVIPPSITCPTSLNLLVDGGCTAICGDYTKSMVLLSDNCTDSVDIVVTQDIPEFTVFGSGPGGTETIMLTATDESGNSSNCSFTLNVIDTQNPIPTCPSDTNIYVDINCDGILGDYIGEVAATDNCSSLANMTITQSPLPGLVINGSVVNTTVTMTILDESGNSATCDFIARTIDTMVATITCPIDTTIYANASCQGILGDYTGDAVASDNCIPSSSLTITQSPIPGTTITTDQVITLTVSGAIPNIDQQCTFNALFADTTSPIITCPAPAPLYVNAMCEATLSDYTGSMIVLENCAAIPTITQNPPASTLITSANDVSITMTVTDATGNSSQCIFTQSVFDTISPSITCPSDQNENADVNCFAILGDYTSLVTTGDNCSSVLNLVQTATPGTSIPTSTSVLMTVTDESGNNSSCSFNVNIIDVTAPTVTCPPNTTVSTNIGCDYTLADFTSSAIGSDNCTPAVSITYLQNPAPGTLLGIGTHSITIDASDASGNTNSCSFDITVEDQTVPTISCPSNQNIIVDASCEGLLLDYTGLATPADNCSAIGNLVLTQSPAAGTTISSTTLVTITVVDENSNNASCVFNAIHIDTISPVVTCPTDQTLMIDASCQYVVPDLSGLVSGTDNCSALANMSITQIPPVASTQSGITPVLITLTDEQGNSTSCFTSLLPDDNIAPTITCPTPAPIDNGASCDYVLTNFGTTASVLDNCSNYTIDQTPPIGTILNPGMQSITLVVTDAGGNTDQCTFSLMVTENQDPTITCPADISTCDPLVSYLDPTFNDNCFAFLTQTDMTGLSSGMNFPIGITTLEYTAADSSGNTQVCSFDVEILEFPSDANIADDSLWLCDQNSTIVSADAITSGTGEWITIAGQGVFNNQFANTTGVNNIAYGESIYVWTVTTASCGNSYDTLVVNNTQQDISASTQDTIYACNDGTVLLQSNTPLYGTGLWTNTGSGVIDDPSSSNTFATLNDSGWEEFIWTITNGSCPVTADTLAVFSSLKPTILTADTSICLEDNMINLVGSNPTSEQTFGWSVISGSGVLSDAIAPSTTVYDLSVGVNLFVYSVDHPYCPTVSDTVEVITSLCDGFDPFIPTMITPNFDGKNDLFVIDYLEQVYPDCQVTIFNRWGSVVFESVGYASPWDGTYKNEPLPMGTYFYKIQLNDSEGTVLKGDISIIH